MTDASTISRSHFHGARRPPSTIGDVVVVARAACAERGVRGVGLRSRYSRIRRRDRRPAAGLPAARRAGVRHLRQREVLGKADRGQPLDRAAEDGEEGAARRVRAARAAIEPGADARALERVLEQAEVFARRAQEDRHLVERARRRAPRRECAARSRRTRVPRLARRRAGRRRAPRARAAAASAKSERRSAAGRNRRTARAVSIVGAERLEIAERREIAEGNGDRASRAPARSGAAPDRTRQPIPAARRAAAAAGGHSRRRLRTRR